jgi:hypothetical protein
LIVSTLFALVAIGAGSLATWWLYQSNSALTARNRSLDSEKGDLSRQLQKTDAELTALRAKIKRSIGNLDRPEFTLWNSCGTAPDAGCPLRSGQHYVGGIPDTFTYEVNFRATVPVATYIFSTSDYVCWETGRCAYTYVWWDARTELTGAVFHDAEGCASYISVFVPQGNGTFYPKVRAIRNPAPHPTGVCA